VLCQANPENLSTVRCLAKHLEAVLVPSWLTSNAHVATAVGFTRLTPRFRYSERQEVLLADGGTVGLDWLHRTGDPRAPVLVLIHGLNGSSDDAYIRWMAHLAVRPEHGRPIWRVAAYLMRGCGSLRLTSTRGYSAADPEDLAAALQAVKERYPEAPIAAAGFSLGGNLLVKYLAFAGANTPLTAAASISNPFALRVDGGVHKPDMVSSLYSRLLAFKLKSYFREHMQVLQLNGPWLAPAVSSCATVRDVDTIVVPRCALYGCPIFLLLSP
jgi:predicted alpha/beta-fold hydrolase